MKSGKQDSPVGICIRRCMVARDGRGLFQAERACAQALGGSNIDRNVAAAARRIGEWLRQQPQGSQ